MSTQAVSTAPVTFTPPIVENNDCIDKRIVRIALFVLSVLVALAAGFVGGLVAAKLLSTSFALIVPIALLAACWIFHRAEAIVDYNNPEELQQIRDRVRCPTPQERIDSHFELQETWNFSTLCERYGLGNLTHYNILSPSDLRDKLRTELAHGLKEHTLFNFADYISKLNLDELAHYGILLPCEAEMAKVMLFKAGGPEQSGQREWAETSAYRFLPNFLFFLNLDNSIPPEVDHATQTIRLAQRTFIGANGLNENPAINSPQAYLNTVSQQDRTEAIQAYAEREILGHKRCY